MVVVPENGRMECEELGLASLSFASGRTDVQEGLFNF